MSSPSTVPLRAARYVGDRAHGGDLRGDPAVGRRHDLAAVAEVDLVAVVLRRVVAGGHHHAGDAAELADRERQHGRRQRPREQQRREPGAAHHLGGVAGEDVGVVAGVVADDHRAARPRPLLVEVRRQTRPRRGRRRRGSSGSAPRRARRGARRCRTPAVPAKRSARSSVSPPASTSATTALQLGAGLGVGIVGDPGASAVEEVADVGRRGGGHPRNITVGARSWAHGGSSGRGADRGAGAAAGPRPVRRGVRLAAAGGVAGGPPRRAAVADRTRLVRGRAGARPRRLEGLLGPHLGRPGAAPRVGRHRHPRGGRRARRRGVAAGRDVPQGRRPPRGRRSRRRRGRAGRPRAAPGPGRRRCGRWRSSATPSTSRWSWRRRTTRTPTYGGRPVGRGSRCAPGWTCGSAP